MKKLELEELKVSIYKKLRRAINEGDKEKAMALLDEIEEGCPITAFITPYWTPWL